MGQLNSIGSVDGSGAHLENTTSATFIALARMAGGTPVPVSPAPRRADAGGGADCPRTPPGGVRSAARPIGDLEAGRSRLALRERLLSLDGRADGDRTAGEDRCATPWGPGSVLCAASTT